MKVLNKEEFKEKIFDFENETEWKYKGELPCIIDFYADWCQPCKVLSPILEELEKEYEGKLELYKIDTDQESELAGMFQIMSIPSLLFVPVGDQPQMTIGLLPKEKLKEAIKEVLKI